MGRQASAVILACVLSASVLHAENVLFTVTAASVDVYKGPSTGSPVIGKAPRGRTFEVTRELGSWVKVAWPDAQDGVGYLHVTFGTISRDRAAETAAPVGTATEAAAPGAGAASSTTSVRIGQRPGTSTLPRSVHALPSHAVGLGGRIGTQGFGFAATGRVWSRGPVGVQIEAGRATYTGAPALEHVSSMQIAPSAVYSLPNMVTNAIWARPYVGAGIGIYRSTLKGGPSTALVPVDTSLGSQVFGGAELTWANLPQFALSADLRHAWAPTPFSGFELGGFGFSMSAHWYVR